MQKEKSITDPNLTKKLIDVNLQQQAASSDPNLKKPIDLNMEQVEASDDPNLTCSCACRYPDGSLRLLNRNIELLERDFLYHLALDSVSHDLVEMFGDVKFVCMGGTPKHMEQFAYTIMKEIENKLPCGTTLQDISQVSNSYSMYKVGPVLSISHGIGVPSVGVLLNEVIKLMYHAKIQDPVFFRIGTCGGIGCESGTVVISDEVVDGRMRNFLELAVLGENIQRPARLDQRLAKELKRLSDPEDPYETIIGKTMCTYDFYEGQGRLDGPFCDFTEADKMEYLESIHREGIVNIEMESLAFAALTHHAGIKAAAVCVTLLDRLKGDQILASKEDLDEWHQRPSRLVCRFIKSTPPTAVAKYIHGIIEETRIQNKEPQPTLLIAHICMRTIFF